MQSAGTLFDSRIAYSGRQSWRPIYLEGLKEMANKPTPAAPAATPTSEKKMQETATLDVKVSGETFASPRLFSFVDGRLMKNGAAVGDDALASHAEALNSAMGAAIGSKFQGKLFDAKEAKFKALGNAAPAVPPRGASQDEKDAYADSLKAWRKRVSEAIGGTADTQKPETHRLTSADHAALQAEFADEASSFNFGERATRTASDPVRDESLRWLEGEITKQAAKQGKPMTKTEIKAAAVKWYEKHTEKCRKDAAARLAADSTAEDMLG